MKKNWPSPGCRGISELQSHKRFRPELGHNETYKHDRFSNWVKLAYLLNHSLFSPTLHIQATGQFCLLLPTKVRIMCASTHVATATLVGEASRGGACSLSGVRDWPWRAWVMALFSTSIQVCMSGGGGGGGEGGRGGGGGREREREGRGRGEGEGEGEEGGEGGRDK